MGNTGLQMGLILGGIGVMAGGALFGYFRGSSQYKKQNAVAVGFGGNPLERVIFNIVPGVGGTDSSGWAVWLGTCIKINYLRQFQNFSFWNCFLKNRNFAGRKAEKLQEVVPSDQRSAQPVLEPPHFSKK